MRFGVIASVLAVGCGADGRGDDAGGGGSTLTIRAPNAPAAMIAYRDGIGAWKTARGADAPFEVPIASGSYTVAFVCATQSSFPQGVAYQMTLAELSMLEHDGLCSESTITISGALTGYTTQSIDLAFGALETGAVSWPGSRYSLGVVSGTHDLIAARGSVLRDRMITVRDLAAVASINQAFDFEGPNAIAMEFPTTPGWPGTTYTRLYTQRGTGIELGLMEGAIVAPPVATMRPGDLLSVTINGRGNGIVTSRRFISHERPLALALPAPLQPAATATARSAATWTIVGATWQPQPNAVLYELFVDGGSWNVYVSPAVFEQQLGAEIPDLSQIPGWETYGLPSLQFHSWSMLALSGASREDHLRTIPVRAAQLDFVGSSGSIRVSTSN